MASIERENELQLSENGGTCSDGTGGSLVTNLPRDKMMAASERKGFCRSSSTPQTTRVERGPIKGLSTLTAAIQQRAATLADQLSTDTPGDF